jgi:hypothetical protein
MHSPFAHPVTKAFLCGLIAWLGTILPVCAGSALPFPQSTTASSFPRSFLAVSEIENRQLQARIATRKDLKKILKKTY